MAPEITTAKILGVALLSMVPTFEGRYAVVVAHGMGLSPLWAYLLAFCASSLPVPFILFLLRPVLKWFYTLPWKSVQRFAAFIERHAEKRAKGMKSGGLWGLFLFVALPVPLTGVWTGSAIASVFRMDVKKSLPVILLGNAIACAIMTLISWGVIRGLSFLL